MSVTVRIPYNFHYRVGKQIIPDGAFHLLTCERGHHHTFTVVGETCIVVNTTRRGPLIEVIAQSLELYASVAHNLNCTQLGVSKALAIEVELILVDPISRPLLVTVNKRSGIEYRHERSQALLYTREHVVVLDDLGTCFLYRAVQDPSQYRPEDLLIRGRTIGRTSYYPLSLLGSTDEARREAAAKKGKEPPLPNWLAKKHQLMARHFPEYNYEYVAAAAT